MYYNNIVKVKLEFEDERSPYLLDISSLLYDFELLHDFAFILFAEEYSDYWFSQYFWYRRGRPLRDKHRLRALKIVKESPLTIELGLSILAISSGAIWILLQAIEKIANFKLNREKLKAEIEKLHLETKVLRYDEQRAKFEIERRLYERNAIAVLNTLLKRLETNPIKLKDIDLSGDETDYKNTE